MDNWKKSFVAKLGDVQARWAKRFDEALDTAVMPAFNSLTDFLRDSGFTSTVPMHEGGRRSFKFELAENAYVLMIFESTALGEFRLNYDLFILGGEPKSQTINERLTNLDRAWAEREFQTALNSFVELLDATGTPADEELVAA